jgi:hypothetical protein
MHTSHRARELQCVRIRQCVSRCDNCTFFNALTAPQRLDQVEILLPAHRERHFFPRPGSRQVHESRWRPLNVLLGDAYFAYVTILTGCVISRVVSTCQFSKNRCPQLMRCRQHP